MLARMENDLRCSAAQLEGRTATRLRYLDDSHIAALRADLVGVGEGAAAEGAAEGLGEEVLLSTMSVRTGMDRTVSRKGHSLLVIALQHLSGPSSPRRSWSNSTQFPSTCWSVPIGEFGLECGC